MDFHVGDYVWIKSLDVEGQILNMDQTGWCTVLLEDNTHIPVHQSHLSDAEAPMDLSMAYREIFNPKSLISNASRGVSDIEGMSSTQGIWLHIMPEYKGEQLIALKIYFSDFGEDAFKISFRLIQQKNLIFFLDNTQAPKKTHFYLYTYKLEELKNSIFQFTFHREAREDISFDYQLSAKKISNQVMKGEGSGSYAILIAYKVDDLTSPQSVDEQVVARHITQRMEQHHARQHKHKPPLVYRDIEETIDLHMEKLGVPFRVYNQWTTHEKKLFQIGFFEKKLLDARKRGVSKLTVIYGVGSGSLRKSCIAYLEKSQIAKSWLDESSNLPIHLIGKMIVYL